MPVSDLVNLARSLGQLETIRIAQPQPVSAAQQHLQYAIVVDFETTCWSTKSLRHPEIIEFPAVLVDLSARRILAEFQQFVRPTESPQLSAFCTDLTGITQSQVDAAQPLASVIVDFGRWLRTTVTEHRLVLPKQSATDRAGNTCFATWSDWDFGVCLRHECERKRLQAKRPACLDQWMDLRALYRTWYANKPRDFGDALRKVGMSFEGRPHSGLADARNEARLACRMWRDGCPMAVTKDLKPFIVFNRLE